MKITAVLGVKDEVELIQACISHLKQIGVTQILAYDGGSTDGTREILECHLQPPDFVVEDFDGARLQDSLIEVNRSSRAWIEQSQPDWVLFLDADEFWIPASGRLQDCAVLAEADVLTVPRFNVPLAQHGPLLPQALVPARHAELELFVRGLRRLRARLQTEQDLAWIRAVPLPKIMARPHSYQTFKQGCHDVIPAPGVTQRRAQPGDLLIAHLPFTTASRFARKLRNIDEVYRVQDARAQHWRRWNQLEPAAVEDEFHRQQLSSAQLDRLRRSGVIRSAAAVLSDAAAAAPAPQTTLHSGGDARTMQAAAQLLRQIELGQQPATSGLRQIKTRLRQQYPREQALQIYLELLGDRVVAPLRLQAGRLLRHARDSGAIRHEFYRREPFSIALPRLVGGAVGTVWQQLRSRRFFIACFEQATVRGQSTIVQVGDQALLDIQGAERQIKLGLDFDPWVFEQDGEVLVTTPPRELRQLAEAFSLVGTNSEAFGHWITQYLSKLSFALSSDVLPAGVPILVDAGMPASHLELLKACVGSRHTVIELPPFCGVRVERLWACSTAFYVPILPLPNQPLGPELMSAPPQRMAEQLRWLQQRLAPLTSVEPTPARIYLSRRAEQHRKLVNADEIEQLMQRRGFAIVYPQDLDFAQQLQLMRGARQIVGPEGSQLMLALFAGPGTRFCLLNHPFFENVPSYTAIIEALGIDTWALVGECVRLHPAYPRFSDYRIEAGQIEALLQAWDEPAASAV